MRATLFTKPACLLCDQMRQVVSDAAKRYDLDVEELDVTADPEIAHLEMSVPLLSIGGIPQFRFTVSAQALRRVLEERGCPRRQA